MTTKQESDLLIIVNYYYRQNWMTWCPVTKQLFSTTIFQNSESFIWKHDLKNSFYSQTNIKLIFLKIESFSPILGTSGFKCSLINSLLHSWNDCSGFNIQIINLLNNAILSSMFYLIWLLVIVIYKIRYLKIWRIAWKSAC